MSATLHVLLEAEPCLEEDVKADPPACHQLGQVSVLQYIGGTAGSMDHQYILDRLDFLEKLLPQLLHWAGEQGRAANGRRSGALGGCLLSQGISTGIAGVG